MKFKRQGDTAMALAIFVGGISLGFILGFVVMALLAVASSAPDPERHQHLSPHEV
jgi:hypothetical protein